MSLSLRTTILATGCILAIGTSPARAQMPLVFYYSVAGNYATTQGTVNIPAAGYYYNVPLYTVPAPASPAPAQGFTYSFFYYRRGGASTEGGGVGVGANVDRRGEPTGGWGNADPGHSKYVSSDDKDDPDW